MKRARKRNVSNNLASKEKINKLFVADVTSTNAAPYDDAEYVSGQQQATAFHR
jgi:hypothetical protein